MKPNIFGPTLLAATLLLGLSLILTGCTETEEVVVPPYDDPPAGAEDFLGYSREGAALTTCGNCHAGVQARWENEDANGEVQGHAAAWKGLQDSGYAQAFCEDCHATGALGNSTESGGYAGAPEARYYDVQCEACHGPGLDHVMNPDDNKVEVSIDVSDDPLLRCGQCHNGSHHGFVNEWAMSRHANVNGNAGGREDCQPCHTAQGALASFGVDSDYAEKDQAEQLPIVCVVCHDPHGTSNPGNMRFPLNAASKENNMCIKCHHKRAEPDEGGRGPHSPEGPLVLGEEVGWWPPGFVPPTDAIRGSHGSERNTNLCATCHVSSREVTDAETGDFIVNAVGHSFKAIPCVDVNGVPLPPDQQDCDVSDRSFASCVSSGCHADETAARSAWVSTEADLLASADELEALLDQVDEAEFEPGTVAKGAEFNMELARHPGTAAHNSFLMRLLLTETKTAVRDEYGVSSPRVLLEDE